MPFAIGPITTLAVIAVRFWFAAAAFYGFVLIWQILYTEAMLAIVAQTGRAPVFMEFALAFLLVFVAVTAAASAVGLTWLYRAAANAGAIDPAPGRQAPERVIGCLFVPIFNLWRGPSAIAEVWNSSTRGKGHYGDPVPGIVAFWWSNAILAFLLSAYALWLRLPWSAPVSMQAQSEIELVALAMCVACGLVWIRIVQTIAGAQNMYVAEVFD